MATLSELHRRLSANDARYALHFAGHPRLTRRPELLATMIADAETILVDVKSLKSGSDRQAITQSAERQRSLYASERTAVVQLQAQIRRLKIPQPCQWEASFRASCPAVPSCRVPLSPRVLLRRLSQMRQAWWRSHLIPRRPHSPSG